nr:glutamic acid-rich protein-like [Tanacetum cinerariifolium]
MLHSKELARPKETALGKDVSNLFMAGSLPKTICLSKDVAVNLMLLEDVIRQALHLDDVDSVECLPNKEIFTELARMGYEKEPSKLMFYKAFFSAQLKFLIHTLVQCISAKRTTWNEFSYLMAFAVICLATDRKFNFSKYIFDSMVRNVDSPSKFLIVGKGFSRVEPHPYAAKKDDEEEEVPKAPTPPSPTPAPSPPSQDPIPTPPQAQPATPSSPPQVDALEQDKTAQALEIFKLKKRVKKLDKKRRSKSSGLKRLRKVGGRIESIDADEGITLVDAKTQVDAEFQRRKDDVSAATIKDASAAEPSVFDDEEVTMTMAQTLIKMKAEKQDFLMSRWLKVKVLGSESTQDTSTVDPKEMYKEDVKNMLEIVLVSEFKVEALQVKYPLIDWEIYSEGSRTYWNIIRVGGITQAYQIFEDMLKDFDREDLDALWRMVKEKFSKAVATVNKEKALWVELKRLFEPNADDVIWKIQRYMHYPIM